MSFQPTLTIKTTAWFATREQWDKGGDLPRGQLIVPGRTVEYLAHVVGGMVAVRHNGQEVIIHPATTEELSQ